jgi:hypothetical protein
MSIEAMAWAKRQKTGDSTTKLVLLMLADWANPGPKDGHRPDTADGRHYTWEGQEGVAEACELSVSSVKRHQAKLRALGLIRTERRFSRSGNRISDYVILACDSAGAKPFPPVDNQDDHTKAQSDTWRGPAETTKCQNDLRSPVVLGPSVTGEPYRTVVPDSKEPLSLRTAPAATEAANQREREIRSRANPDPAVEALVDQALARYPAWSRSDTRRAILTELADGRPRQLVFDAWPRFLADPDTRSPNRFKHPQSWWDVPRPPAAAPRQRKEPCPDQTCDSHHGGLGRVEVPATGGSIALVAPCPLCHPEQTRAAG